MHYARELLEEVNADRESHGKKPINDVRYPPEYIDLCRLRKEKKERVFADAKEKYAMRYTQYRGFGQVTNWVRLGFVVRNLKKLAKWK